MNTGNYDQIVNFIALDNGVDISGGFPQARTCLLRTFASIKEDRSFTDYEQRSRDLSNVFHCKIKYRCSFQPTNLMFIEWNGYRYVIDKVDLVGQRHKREYVMSIHKTDSI